MGWGEKESVSAQMGALRTQLDMAERRAEFQRQRADAWQAVSQAHDAVIAATGDDDDQLDQAIEVLMRLRAVADTFEAEGATL